MASDSFAELNAVYFWKPVIQADQGKAAHVANSNASLTLVVAMTL
jgi:hypothetical protein